MADEGSKEKAPKQEGAGQTQDQAGQQDVPAGSRRIRINMQGVAPEYANFCTLTVRQGEVFMSFGKAFGPANELRVDKQVVMSLPNVEQLHQAMGRMLEQVKSGQPAT